MKKKFSDFRSDTVTRPTKEMREAMANAKVGDDVLGDDPTVKKLERMAARTFGKEAAIFVPSGTMGNTLSLIAGGEEGTEIILEYYSHIYNYESGNLSKFAKLIPRPIKSQNGEMDIEEIKSNIKTSLRIHIPKTSMIALENTHNYHGGNVLSLEYIKEVSKIARENKLHIHLDGARIFNAATYLNVDVKEISKYFDSVMFCLSKGLCSPIGSIVVGRKKFIERVRFLRKSFGGGMRQVGILAAAGIISLEKMTKRLNEDHIRAKKLAEGIKDIKGIKVDIKNVKTNFVMVDLEKMDSFTFLKKLKREGVLALPFSEKRVRFVTHNDVDDKDIEKAIEKIKKVMEKSVMSI